MPSNNKNKYNGKDNGDSVKYMTKTKYIYRKRITKNGKYHHIFTLNRNGKSSPINNSAIMTYVKMLKIPPAYQNVKISLNKNDKVVAIGLDDAQRKQYIYNPKQVIIRDNKKYCNLIDFNEKLPLILKRINAYLKQPTTTKEKLIAIVLKIIIHCNFRIGNDKYRIKHQSYGITTIREKQLKFKPSGGEVFISYIGKKGVRNECNIRDRVIINVLDDMKRDGINRSEYFFSYIDNDSGERKRLTAIDINTFLKEFGNFTSKDFRTIKANMIFIDEMMKRIPPPTLGDSERKRRQQINDIIEIVSTKLHHTKSICKKSYVLKDLYEMYIDDPHKYLKLFVEKNANKNTTENILLRFLKFKCKGNQKN